MYRLTASIFIAILFFSSVLYVKAQFPVTATYEGGTGTSTAPSTGEILVGQGDGTYAPQATSTLGIPTHDPVTLSGALDYITLVGQDIVRGAIDLAADVTGALGIANGGLGAAFTDPNADRLMFWDDSVGAIKGIATLAGAAISGTTLTINDVTCTDCLGTTEIADSYVLNTGDSISGNLTFSGTSANIALGSNYLSGDGGDEGVFVDGSGNVGIGTTTPAGLLHVNGGDTYFGDEANTIRTMYFRRNAATVGGINTTNLSLNLFGGTTSTNSHLSVNSSGLVGVGSPAVAELLEVNGTSGSATIDPVTLRIGSATNASDWATTAPFVALDFYSADGSAAGATTRGRIGLQQTETSGSAPAMVFQIAPSGGIQEAMRILTSGYVGIGTTNPADKFVVEVATNKRVGFEEAPSSAITDFATGTVAMQFARPSDGVDNIAGLFAYSPTGTASTLNLAMAARNDLVFAAGGSSLYTAAPERMRINSSGNVGIGTASPTTNRSLHVYRNSALAEPTLKIEEGSIGDVGLEFAVSGQSWTMGIDNNVSDIFQIAPGSAISGATPSMAFTTGGYVGIGTTAPSGKLHVYDGSAITEPSFSAAAKGLVLSRSGGSGLTLHTTDTGTNYLIFADTTLGGNNWISYEHTNDAMAFRVNNSERMRINSSGRVGIGTTSPSASLHVANGSSGATFSSPTLLVETSGSSNSFAAFQVATAGAPNAMFITNAGNVGIGTTTPAARLSVQGSSSGTILDLVSNTGTKFLSMLNTGVTTLLGTWDFSGATVKQKTHKSFTWPGTATTTTATTTIPLGTAYTAEAWNGADCWVTSGSGAFIFTDGTNRMNGATATTTVSRTTLSTNNTFTAQERRYVEIGPLTAAQISCTAEITVNN